MHCCDKPSVRPDRGRGDCLRNIGLPSSSRVTEWKWKTAAVRTFFVLMLSGWEVEFLAHDPTFGIITAYCQIQEVRDTCQAAFEKSRGFVRNTLDVLPLVCFAFLANCTGSTFASFPSLAWIAARRILSVSIVGNRVLSFAGIFVRGQVALLLLLTLEGGTRCCFGHSHCCKKKKMIDANQ